MKFKVGDRVRFVDTKYRGVEERREEESVIFNKIATITKVEGGCGSTVFNYVEWDNKAIEKESGPWYDDRFELVKNSSKNYKTTLIVKHIVLEEGCNNIVSSIKDTHKEAIESFTPEKDKTYTIYRLEPVSKVELSKKVTKIKKTKITKKVRRKK